MPPIVERTVHFPVTNTFRSGQDLSPQHCEVLTQACLQNGDVKTLSLVDQAAHGNVSAQERIYRILVEGYKVHKNDAPRIL